MTRAIVVAALGMAASGMTPAAAQSPWAIEVMGGAAFPMETFVGVDLNTGFGGEVDLHYRLLPQLAGYVGWSWHRFTTDQPLAAAEVDVEETGYAFGLRYERPLTMRSTIWLRAGGTANHLELEDDDGELIDDTGHGLGWEVGGGLSIPLGTRLLLTPGVRYRALSRDVEIGGVTTSADLRYLTVGAGVVFGF